MIEQMHFSSGINRPPFEAASGFLQVTSGCSHNKCAFCKYFKDTKFRRSPMEQIEHDVKLIPAYFGAPISTKSDEELAELHAAGVSDLYLGVECGLERALAFMNKGHTAEDTRRECARLARAGIRHNDLLMVGTAGAGCGSECAEATARLLNETRPDKILITFLTAFAGTELDKAIQRGEFKMASDREMLQEERELLARLDLPQTYFWAAHSLNSVSVQDFIGSGRDRMLGILDRGIEKMADRPSMRISLTGSL